MHLELCIHNKKNRAKAHLYWFPGLFEIFQPVRKSFDEHWDSLFRMAATAGNSGMKSNAKKSIRWWSAKFSRSAWRIGFWNTIAKENRFELIEWNAWNHRRSIYFTSHWFHLLEKWHVFAFSVKIAAIHSVGCTVLKKNAALTIRSASGIWI